MKEYVIRTFYDGQPYYLKNIETRHGERTVVWSIDAHAAMKISGLRNARVYAQDQDLRRPYAVIQPPVEECAEKKPGKRGRKQ